MNRIMLILLSILCAFFRFSGFPFARKQVPAMAENFTTDFSEIPVVAYNVELQMQIPWQQILFVLFVAGCALWLITLSG